MRSHTWVCRCTAAVGFIEETGAAQHFRDARITTIYEGTTGIQAADLVGRKLTGDGGASGPVHAGHDARDRTGCCVRT